MTRKKVNGASFIKLTTVIGCFMNPERLDIRPDEWPLVMTDKEVGEAIFNTKDGFSLSTIERAAQALADYTCITVRVKINHGDKAGENIKKYEPQEDSIWRAKEDGIEFLEAYFRGEKICDDCRPPKSFDTRFCFDHSPDLLCSYKIDFEKSGA